MDMITARQIKEKLNNEKDPLRYLDGEISRNINQMGDRCGAIRDLITTYNHRENEDDQIDMQKIKEELMKAGELYFEANQYLKVRKEQVKQQKRTQQLNKALAKRQKLMEQMKGSE
jgi:hypothetical protein